MFWNYPHSDYHELNLDWVILILKEMEKKLNDFVSTNSIKYANPFQWNITSQYEKNTLTIDAQSGVAYLSVTAVPAGVSITNTSFWTPVFDLSQMFMDFNDNLSHHDEQQNLTSSAHYDVDDWLIWKNQLYLVISEIHIGDGFVPDLNIQLKSVEELFKAFVQTVTDNFDAFVLSIQGDIDDIKDDITDLQTDVGTLQGDVTTINGKIADINTRNFNLGYMIMLTDSFGANISPNITDHVPAYLNMSAGEYITHATGGCGFGPSCPANYLTELQSIAGSIPDANKVKTILVTGGSNDAGYGDTENDIVNAISAFMTYCKTTYPNARVFVAFTGWTLVYTSANWNPNRFRDVLQMYSRITEFGGYLLDVHAAMHISSNFNGDDIHPNATGQIMLSKAIANSLITGDFEIHQATDGSVTSASGYTVQGNWTATDCIDDDVVTFKILGSGISPYPRVAFGSSLVVSNSNPEPPIIWFATISDYAIGNKGFPSVTKAYTALFQSNELTTYVEFKIVRQAYNIGLKVNVPAGTYTNVYIYLPYHLEIKDDIYNC